METTTQNKQTKLFSNLEIGDVIYHIVYKLKNNKWVLEGYDKITINKFVKDLHHTGFSGIKKNMLYPNVPAMYDTYGIDDYDYEKSVCSWISCSEKLCIFSIRSMDDAKDEIDQILKNNSED